MQPVYVGNGDTSLPVSLSVLPNVIEKSVRTIVLHGGLDYVLIAEGARCVFRHLFLFNCGSRLMMLGVITVVQDCYPVRFSFCFDFIFVVRVLMARNMVVGND